MLHELNRKIHPANMGMLSCNSAILEKLNNTMCPLRPKMSRRSLESGLQYPCSSAELVFSLMNKVNER